MCAGTVQTTQVRGSAKGPQGWFNVTRAHVVLDHPYHAPVEEAVLIDLVNPAEGPGARIALELTPESARALAEAITRTLEHHPVV